jgi:biotin operon repressor
MARSRWSGATRVTADLAARDLVHVALGAGRDNAEPIGALAERLKLTRRQVEQAVQVLRVDGIPVASGSEGIWLTNDPVELAATLRYLRGRIESQNRTAWAVRSTLRRMQAGRIHQLPLFGDAA